MSNKEALLFVVLFRCTFFTYDRHQIILSICLLCLQKNCVDYFKSLYWLSVKVLHICIKLLDNSRDPKTLAVTCNDIAEFIQIHPAGRGIILDLKGKERVMNHPNPQTAKQALLCVQNVLLGAKNAIYIKQSIFL